MVQNSGGRKRKASTELRVSRPKTPRQRASSQENLPNQSVIQGQNLISCDSVSVAPSISCISSIHDDELHLEAENEKSISSRALQILEEDDFIGNTMKPMLELEQRLDKFIAHRQEQLQNHLSRTRTYKTYWRIYATYSFFYDISVKGLAFDFHVEGRELNISDHGQLAYTSNDLNKIKLRLSDIIDHIEVEFIVGGKFQRNTSDLSWKPHPNSQADGFSIRRAFYSPSVVKMELYFRKTTVELCDPLAALLGNPSGCADDITEAFFLYARENRLMHFEKGIIICDTHLERIFGVKQIPCFDVYEQYLQKMTVPMSPMVYFFKLSNLSGLDVRHFNAFEFDLVTDDPMYSVRFGLYRFNQISTDLKLIDEEFKRLSDECVEANESIHFFSNFAHDCRQSVQNIIKSQSEDLQTILEISSNTFEFWQQESLLKPAIASYIQANEEKRKLELKQEVAAEKAKKRRKNALEKRRKRNYEDVEVITLD